MKKERGKKKERNRKEREKGRREGKKRDEKTQREKEKERKERNKRERKKIIAWGVGAAFVFRIFFATGVNYIFEFAWVKILGGVLLVWVINNLRQDFFGRNKMACLL